MCYANLWVCIYAIVCFCESAGEVIVKRLHLQALKNKLRKMIGIHSKSLRVPHTLLYKHIHTKQSCFISIIHDYTFSYTVFSICVYIQRWRKGKCFRQEHGSSGLPPSSRTEMERGIYQSVSSSAQKQRAKQLPLSSELNQDSMGIPH